MPLYQRLFHFVPHQNTAKIDKVTYFRKNLVTKNRCSRSLFDLHCRKSVLVKSTRRWLPHSLSPRQGVRKKKSKILILATTVGLLGGRQATVAASPRQTLSGMNRCTHVLQFQPSNDSPMMKR